MRFKKFKPWGFIIFLIPVVFTVSSCELYKVNPDLGPNSLQIALDTTVYHIFDPIRLVISNHSNSDLVLRNCGFQPGYTIEKFENNKWRFFADPKCVAVGNPFEINAGSIFIKSISLESDFTGIDSIEGKYRLKLWLLEKRFLNRGWFLADSLRTTGAFEIVN